MVKISTAFPLLSNEKIVFFIVNKQKKCIHFLYAYLNIEYFEVYFIVFFVKDRTN